MFLDAILFVCYFWYYFIFKANVSAIHWPIPPCLGFILSCSVLFCMLIYFLLLICDAVHNAMTSQQCNTNAYCMVVLHACIHEPLVRSQPKPKIVRSATGSTE